MELGARWGTWGLRGIALLHQLNPMPYRLLSFVLWGFRVLGLGFRALGLGFRVLSL